MNELFYVVSGTAIFVVQILLWAVLFRAVMSMYADDESPSRFYIFCCAVTEPVVAPTRRLLERIPSLQESPIDFSFFATAFVLVLIESALRVFA